MKGLGLVVALAIVVGGGVALVVTQGAQTEGMATGKGSKVDVMWSRLQEFRDPYLDDWMAAFDKKKPEPQDVLEAWNEVAMQVTGPTGFWRGQVPNRWMGCKQLPDSAACGSLSMAEETDFRKYDSLAESIHEMEPKDARKFLADNYDTMMDYLDHYVPADQSMSGMQKTPFFQESLADAMREDGML
jgi:hypothetical protein